MQRLLLVCLLAGVACASRQPVPVCHLDLHLQLFPPWQADPKDFDVAIWNGLLLRGTDMDCTGHALALPADGVTPLQAPEVLLTALGGDEWLVWLKSHRTSHHVTVGPIARVKVAYEKVRVMAVGTLEAADDTVSLQYHTHGPVPVLQVVTGNCPTQAQGGLCAIDAQLLAEVEGRFVAAPGGTVALRRREAIGGGPSSRRILTLDAELTAAGDGFELQERVTVQEEGLGPTPQSNRLLRQSKAQRSLSFTGSSWNSGTTSLWERVRASQP